MRITIGEMSKLHDVSIHTLRYYDKVGLLVPSEVDSDTGYRYYDEEDSHRLSRIKVFKAVGLPIEEIRKLLKCNVGEVEEAYRRMRDQVSTQIDYLVRLKCYLDEKLLQIEDAYEGRIYSEPAVIALPKMYGIKIPVEDTYGLTERIQAIVGFEKRAGVNSEVFYKPSRIMSFDRSGNRVLESYLALCRDAVFTDQIDENDDYEKVVFDDGEYGVLDYQGSSTDLYDYYMRLVNHLEGKGVNYEQRSLEIIIVNAALTDLQSEWRGRILIPIVAE